MTEATSAAPYVAFNPLAPRLSLKHGAVFLVTDRQGYIPGLPGDGFGLYQDDTRWLSRWQVGLRGEMLHLTAALTDDGFRGAFRYVDSSGTLTVERKLVLTEGLVEQILLTNTGLSTREVNLEFGFGCDFADMFEVRGTKRQARGAALKTVICSDYRRVTLAYQGLDRKRRRTFVDFVNARPHHIAVDHASFSLRLEPGETKHVTAQIRMKLGNGMAPILQLTSYEQESAIAEARYRGWTRFNARIATSNREFNAVLERAVTDIYSLRQESKHGICLAAGVPWFAVPFGRDDFITALQTVRFMPRLSAEILEFFTHYQGKKFDEELNEEPGKMPHEIRSGEMANCREIVFRPYYGTVDATQLWLMLLSEYVVQTGDLDLPRRLWKHIRSAEQFLSRSTADGAQFIYYGGKPGQALSNTCWKDSGNSMVYSDGSQPRHTPIAVCEAQGYLYRAWTGLAHVSELLGHRRYARDLLSKSARLKSLFRQQFWMPSQEFFAMAVDGSGRQLDVVSSNPGHLLGTGIISLEEERKLAERIMRNDMFTGWGIRTLSSVEKAYDPNDYQVGAVWPHDNGFAGSAMTALGKPEFAHELFTAMFDVARCNADLRLPELFCGQDREAGKPYVPYNVACVPQAWAAGFWFQMLNGMMNIAPDGVSKTLRVTKPALPAWLGVVTVRELRVGEAEVDLEFAPDQSGATICRVTRKSGDVDCLIDCE